MIDYRLKENRFKLFKDFYWFHTKYKIHPGLVYLYLPEITKNMTKEQKYWVAFLEGCTQNPNTVYAILQYFPNRPWTQEEMSNFKEWLNNNYSKLEYDTDRIHFKGKLYTQLEHYNEIVGESQEKKFEEDLYDEDPKKYFTNVFNFVLNEVWGFGRMSSWSYVEFIKICCGLNYEFWDFYMRDQESSMSMRNGLLLLYGRDDLHVWKELPDNPKSHSKEIMDWAEQEVRELKEYLKTQYTDIEVTGETLESILCAFKNLIRGRRYPNIYTDMSYDRIKKAEKLWGQEVDFSLFWEIREEQLPHTLLKEFNYDGYMQDYEKEAVTKKKQMFFRETGQPLFLDLFFDYYNPTKPLIFGNPKTRVIDIKKRELRLNKFFTQDLEGKSIYEKTGFNADWFSKIYDITPIELHSDTEGSIYFKREDYFAPLGYGAINGAKLRQAMYLCTKQVKGYDSIITGATSISPQLPMTSALSKYLGLPCRVVAYSPEGEMVKICKGFGAEIIKATIPYSNYAKAKVAQIVKEQAEKGEKIFEFKYGLTIDFDNSTPEEIKEFYGVGANQVRCLEGTNIEDLIIALGSSNSSVAVLYGLMKYKTPIKRVHLVGVGPSTLDKLKYRLELLAQYEGLKLEDIFDFVGDSHIAVTYYDLFAEKLWDYSDRCFEKFDNIDFHYTYEGKEMRYIKKVHPELIKDTSIFWIIGGPVSLERCSEYFDKD